MFEAPKLRKAEKEAGGSPKLGKIENPKKTKKMTFFGGHFFGGRGGENVIIPRIIPRDGHLMKNIKMPFLANPDEFWNNSGRFGKLSPRAFQKYIGLYVFEALRVRNLTKKTKNPRYDPRYDSVYLE